MTRTTDERLQKCERELAHLLADHDRQGIALHDVWRRGELRQEALEAAEARLAKVRELHAPLTDGCFTVCAVCDESRDNYPCATIRALDGDA